MIGELYINNTDAYTYGVVMGKGFIEALKAPIAFKSDVENESAIEDGKRAVLSPYYASREITLTFNIHGSNKTAFASNEQSFLNILYGRKLTVRIKGDDNRYRLVYTGKSASYARSFSGTTCTYTAKFTEMNPRDRGASPINPLFTI